MISLRICSSGLRQQWNKVIQKNNGASFNHTPAAVGPLGPQLDIPFRNIHLPHSITTPLMEHTPAIKKVDSFLMSVFPQVVDDVKTTPEYKDIPDMMDRLMGLIKWNIPDGKRQRSIAIFNGYKLLMDEEGQKLSLQELEKSAKFCWCVELIHWFIITLDDIVDDATIRRQKPAWFKTPGVGATAINDAVTVGMYAFEILKRNFADHPRYLAMVEQFLKISYITHLGQGYDILTKDTANKKVKFELFTMEKYRDLAFYKTTYYTYTNNLEMALLLANKYDPSKMEPVQPIFNELGYFFQMHNDCKDLFRNQGEHVRDDKIHLGTDIAFGKVTWFAIRVLERGSLLQKKIIYDHYGKENRDSVEEVLRVYQQLELVEEFAEYEEKSFKWVCDKTVELNNVISNDFFHYLIARMYRRDPYLIWGSSK